MAAIIYCWQQQQHVHGWTSHLWDISSGATCVADLDSGALALTKEVSGNSRDPVLDLFMFSSFAHNGTSMKWIPSFRSIHVFSSFAGNGTTVLSGYPVLDLFMCFCGYSFGSVDVVFSFAHNGIAL